MRLSTLIAAAFALAAGLSTELSATEDTRDFVFTDEEGHLVLRFVGAGTDIEEVLNVQLSTMVHDRLRADSVFEAEPVDAAWADSVAPRIERHLSEGADAFSQVDVECRSASCRVWLDHASTWTVAAHQGLMETAERAVRTFIAAHPATFEPAFLIAAHYQEPGRPYMKLFLKRAAGDG